jgi:hypothetical protein
MVVEVDPASGDRVEVEDKAVNGWLAEKGTIVAHPPSGRNCEVVLAARFQRLL